MKLPTDKKTRMQIFIAAGVVAIAIVLGVPQFVILPMVKARKAALERIQDLKGQLDQARGEITTAQGVQGKKDSVWRQLKDIDEKHMLVADFGNYLIGVQDYLEGVMKGVGIESGRVREFGVQQVPEMNVFRNYAVQVSVDTDLATVMNLMHAIETNNPYSSITDIGISSTVDPMEHTVNFKVHWPIWTDPEMSANLVAMAEKNDDLEGILEGFEEAGEGEEVGEGKEGEKVEEVDAGE